MALNKVFELFADRLKLLLDRCHSLRPDDVPCRGIVVASNGSHGVDGLGDQAFFHRLAQWRIQTGDFVAVQLVAGGGLGAAL